jgi:glutamyl-tRNA synthetase
MAIGRYAPSPTGTLHLGNLRTAVAAWLFARHNGSDFRLRWEDLDRTAQPGFETSQRRDLARLGLDFDGDEMRQSARIEVYRETIAELTRAGLTYPCWCSRRDIRDAPAAPHGPPGAYPGTCRDLSATTVRANRDSGRPPALRLRTDADELTVIDRLRGPLTGRVDDFVLARGDGTPSYNLVVVVDDAAQGVEEVVRGEDLLDSTPRHAYLQRVLGIPEPVWTHVPLVVDSSGVRLAKRDGSNGLDRWLDAGGSVAGLIAAFGRTLGIEVDTTATLADLLVGFEPDRIPPHAATTGPSGAELALLP